jgi:uncharacterized membrane protein
VVLPPVPPKKSSGVGRYGYLRRSLSVAVAALFAALYALITIVETTVGGPLTFGFIQVRISDAMLPLAMIFGVPSAIGLCVGTIVANAFYMLGPLDIVLGSLANLIAGVLSAKYSRGNPFLAAAYPIVVVTLIVGSYLQIFFVDVPVWLVYGGIFLGEVIACMVVGVPLLKAVQRGLGEKKVE